MILLKKKQIRMQKNLFQLIIWKIGKLKKPHIPKMKIERH